MFACCRAGKRKRDDDLDHERADGGVAMRRAASPASFLSLRAPVHGGSWLQRCLQRMHMQQPMAEILHDESLKSQRPLDETPTDAFILRSKESASSSSNRGRGNSAQVRA